MAGRPLLAAQECGFRPGLLEQASRIAGQEGSTAKRAGRLGLYLSMRLGSALPGSGRMAAVAARLAPGVHDALLRRYIAYGSNGMHWRLMSPVGMIAPGAHEAAILLRLGNSARQHR